MVSIEQAIESLNHTMLTMYHSLTDYAFGYSYRYPPSDAFVFINSGLCHVFALLVKRTLPHLDATIVGTPSHVFLYYEGKYFDSYYSQGTRDLELITTYPESELFDFDSPTDIYNEFCHLYEALTVVRSAFIKHYPASPYIQILNDLLDKE